jgi:hypothetical protein
MERVLTGGGAVSGKGRLVGFATVLGSIFLAACDHCVVPVNEVHGHMDGISRNLAFIHNYQARAHKKTGRREFKNIFNASLFHFPTRALYSMHTLKGPVAQIRANLHQVTVYSPRRPMSIKIISTIP